MHASPLRLVQLCHAYGDVEVLRELNVEVEPGEFVAVVGPSGCGKSTLLAILAGHLKPSGGTVERHGLMRTVYQQDGLFPWLTVVDNIRLGLISAADPARREQDLSDLVRLIRLQGFEKHYPHQLSGGMRQRVELARALAGSSDVLLMDEPMSALDYQTRLRLRGELIRMLRERPRTVVFVTHDIEEAAQLADRIVVLSPRPARIIRELRLDLPHPRPPTHPVVVSAVEQILHELGLQDAPPVEAEQDPGSVVHLTPSRAVPVTALPEGIAES